MLFKCQRKVFDLDLCKKICELQQCVGLFQFFPVLQLKHSLTSSVTYTHSQVLGDTEEGVGQNAGGSAMYGMTAGVVDKNFIHVEVKELPEETAAFCSLIMGKTHKSQIF